MLARLLILWLLCSLCLGHTVAQDDQTRAERPITTIAFGSCIKQDKPTPIFKSILDAKPELFVFLGDNIYADTSDMAVMRAKYATLGAIPEFAQLRQSTIVHATWDDHDYGVNDGGADYEMRKQAQREFLDFWGDPDSLIPPDREGIYHAKSYGPPGERIQLIMLDTRYFRSPLKQGERRVGGPYVPDEDESKTMLGDQQWMWLEQQLREPADLRLVASSIQFAAASSGQETWSNLPRERAKFLELIQTTEASGVILLSGDRHWAEISVLDQETPYPILDVTSSSLNQKHERGTPTENEFRMIETTVHEENFGMLTIDWSADDPSILVEIRDAQNRPRLSVPIRLSDLKSE